MEHYLIGIVFPGQCFQYHCHATVALCSKSAFKNTFLLFMILACQKQIFSLSQHCVRFNQCLENQLLFVCNSQEAQVLQRVSELRRQGMWSSRRLPKVQEPTRCKSHWDYVLSEMQWLAVDFAQERRWKMTAAKKVGSLLIIIHFFTEISPTIKKNSVSNHKLDFILEINGNLMEIMEGVDGLLIHVSFLMEISK